MTTIKYNSVNPFSGLSPTPFVGRQVDMITYADRFGESETLTLRGLITGACISYPELVQRQSALISGFSSDFKRFEIFDGATSVFARDLVKVVGINFDASNYSRVIPYAITLQTYPSGYFSGQYGILDPKNVFVYDESPNRSMTVTHTVSAKGFNTNASNNNALQNAKSWVQSQTGLSALVAPLFNSLSGRTLCLTTVAESSSRTVGTYAIKEIYTTDLTQTGAGILRFNVAYEEEVTSFASVLRVQGDIAGCKNGSLSGVRARYSGFDAYAEALKVYRHITGRDDLSNIPLTKGVSEDEGHVKISFSYTFDNRLVRPTYFDYKIDFNNNIENDIIGAKINGKISSILPLADRWSAIYSLANSIDLFSIVLPFYRSYAAANIPAIPSGYSSGLMYELNPNALSITRIEDELSTEIALEADFQNSRIPPYGFTSLETSVDITPALTQFSEIPCLDGTGKYMTTNLGYATRAQATIEVSAIGEEHQTKTWMEAALKAYCLDVVDQYATGARRSLESQSVKWSNSSFELADSVVASCSWEESPFSL